MKLKSAVKLRLSQMVNATIIYYIVIVFVEIGKYISMFINKNAAKNLIYPEIVCASAIFLFVCGLNCFKPELKILLQNGCTRQDAHYSFILFLPITFIFSLIDTAFYYLQFAVGSIADKSITFYDDFAFFFEYAGKYNKFTIVLLHFFLSALIYMVTISLGYLISGLYYRLNKTGKIFVSICVPAIFTICSALASVSNSGDMFGQKIFTAFVLGTTYFNAAYINHFIASMIMLIVIFTSCAHLLIRKAPVKR